jgi:Tfp pilus assembly protein PilF/predicted AlkP superfamily pyrophosphatase or phosphodiesterase
MKKKASLIVAAAVVVAALTSSLQRIPAGKIGIAEAGGSLETLKEGLHLRLPWSRATVYPIEPSAVRIVTSVEVPGGRIDTRLSLEISVDPDRATSLHRSYHGRYAEDLISPLTGEHLRRDMGLSSASTPVADDRLATKLSEALGPSLEPYGLIVHSVSVEAFDKIIDEEDTRRIELAQRLGGRVVIIGSDAFDWEIYEQVSREHPMPHMEKLIAQGATGDLVSMEPLVSPMIWTTMATGVDPDIHGIIDFLMKDAETGEDVPITSSMRKVPAIWNMMTRFGMTSGFIGWLGTYPAEPVSGFLVSDRIVYHTFDPRWQKGTDHEDASADVAGLTYPEALIHDLRPLILDYDDVTYETVSRFVRVSPDEITPEAKTFDRLDPIRNLRLILASNMTYERIAAYTYEMYHPRLLSVYLDLVDNICHLFIKHMDPPTSDVSAEEAVKYGDAIAAAYVHTDSLIGEWLELIDDETTLIMISDHGFKSGDIRPKGPSAIGWGQAVKWHRLTGAIALYGNRVKPGVRIGAASVRDVTPTVLRLLGLPSANDMGGRVLEEALSDGWLSSSQAIGEIDTYGSRTAFVDAVRREQEEEAILERLRALGYVGGTTTDLGKLAGSHFNRAEFDKAIEIWKEMLTQDPGNAEIMTSIGNAQLQKGDLTEAMATLKDAVKQDPDFLAARNVLALCYINLNQLGEAERLAHEVISRDPTNAEAYFNLGVIFDKGGLHDQALSAFKRSVELRGDYDESRINLANEYLRRGSFRHATEQLERAIEINPDNPHTWYLLARAHQGMRDNDSAIEAYRESLRRVPAFNRARISLSVLLTSLGRLEEAVLELEAATQYPEDLSMVYTNLGVLKRRLGDDRQAEKHFKRAIEIDEYYLSARFDLVDLYIGIGEEQKARKQLQTILKIDPANDRARALIENLR